MKMSEERKECSQFTPFKCTYLLAMLKTVLFKRVEKSLTPDHMLLMGVVLLNTLRQCDTIIIIKSIRPIAFIVVH